MAKEKKLPTIAMYDLLWNTILGVLCLFILALVQMSQAKEKDEKKVETTGEFAVVVDWPKEYDDDVDVYVLDPKNNLVCFRRRESGLMHLERDDLGSSNDRIIGPEGQPIKVDKNEERVIIRGIVPGEYVVNLHMYSKSDPKTTPVKTVLLKLKGADTPITEKVVFLEKRGDEVTVFRFTIKADGSVININELPRRLAAPQSSQPGP